VTGGLFTATLPWDEPDYPKNHGMGNGQQGVSRFTFPDPDDPEVLVCLNCELPEQPDGVCEAHVDCPFTPAWRRERLQREQEQTYRERKRRERRAREYRRRSERMALFEEAT